MLIAYARIEIPRLKDDNTLKVDERFETPKLEALDGLRRFEIVYCSLR